MNICPICKITFFPEDYESSKYCSGKCMRKATYQHRVRTITSTVEPKPRDSNLMLQLAEYGIRDDQIPTLADNEFLGDLLLALRAVGAPKRV